MCFAERHSPSSYPVTYGSRTKCWLVKCKQTFCGASGKGPSSYPTQVGGCSFAFPSSSFCFLEHWFDGRSFNNHFVTLREKPWAQGGRVECRGMCFLLEMVSAHEFLRTPQISSPTITSPHHFGSMCIYWPSPVFTLSISVVSKVKAPCQGTTKLPLSSSCGAGFVSSAFLQMPGV